MKAFTAAELEAGGLFRNSGMGAGQDAKGRESMTVV
jgi:hypothetical protein